MKFLKTLVSVILLVFVFDLFINLVLPKSIKKQIGTSRNYSLKSIKFHHSIAPEINVYELWGKKKYKIKTNELSMRINENEDLKIDRQKDYVGFIGDSFVYGSGVDYNDHFISMLENKNYNFLNLGYVSYSPSIYFKRLEHLIKNEKIKFKTIFLFIDHSDIQDEAHFYREDNSGNIVRKWLNDDDVKSKNRKYKIKNYFKQNSFIFKLYENISAPKISDNAKECLKNNQDNINYKKYLDNNRFGYGYLSTIQNNEWVKLGISKSIKYLDKIKILSKIYDFNLIIVNYPSALEVIDKIHSEESKHFIFLKKWSSENNVKFIDTRDYFLNENNINDYLSNFIECDAHWNKKGQKIISQNINRALN